MENTVSRFDSERSRNDHSIPFHGGEMALRDGVLGVARGDSGIYAQDIRFTVHDLAGRALASGTYDVRLASEERVISRKAVLPR